MIINLNCTIGHDVIIEDFVTFYPGVNVSSCAVIDKGVELGTGAQIIKEKVESETIIGAGVIVTKDLLGRCTAVVGMSPHPVKYKQQVK